MLNRLLIAAALLIVGISAASATTVAVSTANVNLRAGPSTAYPVVTTIPAGSNIVTHGCVSGYSWCDVAFGQYRGWVSSSYIQVVYNGSTVVLTPAVAPATGVTVVTYSRTYWDTYYYTYPWYASWTAYPAYQASVTGTAVGPNGGTATRTTGCVGVHCGTTGTVNGANGGTATGARGCGPRGCAAGGTATGPNGNTATGAFGCGWRGCGAVVVGPEGNAAARGFRR
ncbi:MAG: SH3 domain-containing protein [Pseudomonadota bacterium]